jgi:hypothetical protein
MMQCEISQIPEKYEIQKMPKIVVKQRTSGVHCASMIAGGVAVMMHPGIKWIIN